MGHHCPLVPFSTFCYTVHKLKVIRSYDNIFYEWYNRQPKDDGAYPCQLRAWAPHYCKVKKHLKQGYTYHHLISRNLYCVFHSFDKRDFAVVPPILFELRTHVSIFKPLLSLSFGKFKVSIFTLQFLLINISSIVKEIFPSVKHVRNRSWKHPVLCNKGKVFC